jgi:lipoyl(octanoyl) transferase
MVLPPENRTDMKELLVVELGRIEYGAAWELQKRVAAARKAGAVPDVLLVCEHPHVITLGRSGKISNLRATAPMLETMGVSFRETDRGGDITYHGPGQLVGYPILNLNEIRRDVAWYVRSLEEVMIRVTADFGVASRRVYGRTGVWVEVPAGRVPGAPKEMEEGKEARNEEKLGAIGVHISRWVTSHGFAYNVSTDLRYFDLIVPCGIAGKRATSLEKLLGRRVETNEVAPRIVEQVGEIFGLVPRASSRGPLEELLRQVEAQPAEATA